MAAVTSAAALARATGLPFAPTPLSFTNGGLRVALHTTGALPTEATAIELVEPDTTPEDVASGLTA